MIKRRITNNTLLNVFKITMETLWIRVKEIQRILTLKINSINYPLLLCIVEFDKSISISRWNHKNKILSTKKRTAQTTSSVCIKTQIFSSFIFLTMETVGLTIFYHIPIPYKTWDNNFLYFVTHCDNKCFILHGLMITYINATYYKVLVTQCVYDNVGPCHC